MICPKCSSKEIVLMDDYYTDPNQTHIKEYLCEACSYTWNKQIKEDEK
jgi:transposase-like protein